MLEKLLNSTSWKYQKPAQYSTEPYSTVQYSTVQYSTVQYSTVQYSTVQYCTVHRQVKLYFPFPQILSIRFFSVLNMKNIN